MRELCLSLEDFALEQHTAIGRISMFAIGLGRKLVDVSQKIEKLFLNGLKNCFE